MTAPEIETYATAPVIDGATDGIVEIGLCDGEIVGSRVGAAVMKISQNRIRICSVILTRTNTLKVVFLNF